MDVKENLKNVDTWIRGLFIVIFGVIFYFLVILIWLLVIFQFLTKLFTGSLNRQLSAFSHSISEYALQVLNYVTFQSEMRPFPFSPYPGTEVQNNRSGNDGDGEEDSLDVTTRKDS